MSLFTSSSVHCNLQRAIASSLEANGVLRLDPSLEVLNLIAFTRNITFKKKGKICDLLKSQNASL